MSFYKPQTKIPKDKLKIDDFLAQIIVIVTTLLHFISPTLPTPLLYLLTTMPSKQVSSPALIRHFRNEKGTGAEICPAIVSEIVTGDAPINYWPFWFPRSLCER